MIGSNSALGGWAPLAPLPCERCGAAPRSARVAVGGRKVCLACADGLRTEAQRQPATTALFPPWYIAAVGAISPVGPPLLAGLNWQRLGEPQRARACLALLGPAFAVQIGVVLATILGLGLPEFLAFVVAYGLLLAFSLSTLPRRYLEHEARGGRPAQLFAPTIALVGFMLATWFTVACVAVATGKIKVEPPPADLSAAAQVSSPPADNKG